MLSSRMSKSSSAAKRLSMIREPYKRRRVEFYFLTVLSLVIALAGLWYGPGRFVVAFNSDCTNCVPDSAAISLCIWIAWAWVLVVVLTAIRHQLKAFWLFLAAPFSLYWPVMWIKAGACDLIGRCG